MLMQNRITATAVLLAALVTVACSCDPSGPVFDAWLDGAPCVPATCVDWCVSHGLGSGVCVAGDCVCDGAGDGSSDGVDVPPNGVLVSGRVWSPGHVVPISQALVYFAATDPPAIPEQAYPEECVEPPSAFSVMSRPDGTFDLWVTPGPWTLVVQKGQFRRVTHITVPEGDAPMTLDELLTTLPDRDGPGDTIPNMALVYGIEGGDHIEDVLAKLNMGAVGSDNRLTLGTEQFSIYNISGYPPNSTLLGNLTEMLQYHIIFFPCTIDGYPQLNDPTGPLWEATVLDDIRAYLDAGGKIYATDMMYDVFEQPLPEYVEFCGDDATIDAGDYEAWAHSETMSGWTSHGHSVDPDLTAWLDANAIGSTGLDFLMNFVWIEDYLDTPDPLPTDPQPVKVWVVGDFILDSSLALPLTVTFRRGNGKVLFSTYHTVGDPGGAPGHPGIFPQEFVLVYLIMEIGVCQPPLI